MLQPARAPYWWGTGKFEKTNEDHARAALTAGKD